MNAKFMVAAALLLLLALTGCNWKTTSDALTTCASIINEADRDECYTDIAIAKRDYPICDSVSELEAKKNCYLKVAKYTGDIWGCDKIPDPDYVLFCKSWINKEPLGCEDIVSDSMRDECFLRIAVSLKDILLCDKIIEMDARDSCYQAVGTIIEDFSLCEKINSTSSRDVCYRDVAIRKKELMGCMKIEDSTQKDFCMEWARL